jgi:predicted amidohydrolase
MDVAVGRPEENLQQAASLAREAAGRGAQFLLLPELWLTGYDLTAAPEHAHAFQKKFQEHWVELARETDLWMAGSVLAPDPSGKPANTAMVLSPHGETVATYRKVHLFEPMGEVLHLVPGDEAPTFDLPWGRAALAICYDLRFPEIFRRYALDGALWVLLPAQWPRSRVEHWRTLLRARAIENQGFVIACNRAGRDPEEVFGGYSAVIDPQGRIVAEAGPEPALLLAEIDLTDAANYRESFPVLSDRRPDLYPKH